jgi:hypothetical protein
MGVLRPFYQDPYAPVLFESPALDITLEQRVLIKLVLDKACSDSRFSQKAYEAVVAILTTGPTEVPSITSLNPDSATVGDAAFDVHVVGTGFNSGSTIVFNGVEEPTTFNSETDLSTGVNMPLWQAAAVVPIHVQNAQGVLSNPMAFTFNDPVTRSDVQKLFTKDDLERMKQNIEAGNQERTGAAFEKPPVSDKERASTVGAHKEPGHDKP